MQYLVTGGAGFIGSNFVRMALSGAFEELPIERLVVLDKLTYAGNINNLALFFDDPRFSFIEGDICDAQLVKKILKDTDVVINFAAESHVDRSIDSSMDFIKTNIVGVETLLNLSLKNNIKIFVQISTDEVYGSISSGSWNESSPLEPNSPYAASKSGADLIIRAFNKTHGIDTRITRCSNNYGPFQNPEKAVPLFITNIIEGKKLPIYGDGKNIREWIHVEDHCRGIALSIKKGKSGGIYNISGGLELSNLELSREILSYFNLDERSLEFVKDRKGHDYRYSLDGDFAKKELGYQPRINFSSGMQETIKWYRENKDWWQPLKNVSL